MAPFSSFATTHWIYGSPRLERYNGLSSMNIQGAPAPGKSSGQAMAAMEKIAAQLPPGIGFEWTGLSAQERESGNQAPALYGISILVVFLLLAALYESWSIPLSVIMVIPLGIIGALLATTLRGLSNDIYFQVGLLTTMGLASKNAILIVEFAKDLYEKGMVLVEATVEAVRIRLRPIIMTSLAFVFGVLPLAISNGAGSGSQHAIGTGVIGGMLSATILAIFFVPLFFVIVEKIFKPKHKRAEETPAIPAEGPQNDSAMFVRNLTLTLLAATSAHAPAPWLPPPSGRPCRWPRPGRPPPSRPAASAADLAWREVFIDPRLRAYRTGAEENRDLRVALLNIEKARAQYGVQRAALLPGINAGVSASKSRTPASISQTGSAVETEQYSANVGFTGYELDLFGRVRSLNQAALQNWLATRENSRTAQISLIAEVAGTWLTLAADEDLLRLAQDTLAARDESLKLTQSRVDNGAASTLDLRQAQTLAEQARADVATYIAQVNQDKNALRLVVGADVPADLTAGRRSRHGPDPGRPAGGRGRPTC
jgi:hypothetical protein